MNGDARPGGGLSLSRGIWALADPKISLASLSAMFLGACVAAASAPLDWGWLAVTVLGIYALEVAKNASGEVFDFDSGTDLAVAAPDRSPFSGGKRVLVDGLLTRSQTWTVAIVAYVVAAGAGLVIVVAREPSVLWLGLIGVGCAFFYHAPPPRLSYRGLGELTVAFCYGPLLCSGTYLVQRGSVSAEVILLSVPLGLLIGNFLLINEFPDWRADDATGKRTLVVRLGPVGASRLFAATAAVAAVALLVIPLIGEAPKSVWLGLVAGPTAGFAVGRLRAHPFETARLVPAQAAALATFVLHSVGTGVGVLLG